MPASAGSRGGVWAEWTVGVERRRAGDRTNSPGKSEGAALSREEPGPQACRAWSTCARGVPCADPGGLRIMWSRVGSAPPPRPPGRDWAQSSQSRPQGAHFSAGRLSPAVDLLPRPRRPLQVRPAGEEEPISDLRAPQPWGESCVGRKGPPPGKGAPRRDPDGLCPPMCSI